MKHNIILVTAVLTVTTNSLAIAGSILDDYASGDDLTASKMRNIKTAVDDNDERIGNLELLTSNLANSGNTTDYYYISASDFYPVGKASQIDTQDSEAFNDKAQWNYHRTRGHYGFPTNLGVKAGAHGVKLPHGAIITGMTCYYFDNDATYNIIKFDFTLFARPVFGTTLDEGSDIIVITDPDDDKNEQYDGNGGVTITGPVTNGANSNIQELEAHANNNIFRQRSTAPLSHTVDNNAYQYTARVRLEVDPNDQFGSTSNPYSPKNSNDSHGDVPPAEDSNIRTYGCRIKYTR